MPSISRGNGNRARKTMTSKQDVLRSDALLKLLDAQIGFKKKDLDRLRGEIAFLVRRRKKLVEELSHKAEREKKAGSEGETPVPARKKKALSR